MWKKQGFLPQLELIIKQISPGSWETQRGFGDILCWILISYPFYIIFNVKMLSIKYYEPKISPHVKGSKTVLDSSTKFQIVCQLKLDSRFQSLVGFQIPFKVKAVLQIPKTKIPYSTSKNLSLHGARK